METFTPIAMKCTKEQFDAIKPKLDNKKSLTIFMFNKNWDNFYLALFKDGRITNGLTCSDINLEIHEEWNEEIFLKACGIETEPNLIEQLEKAEAEVKRLKEAIEEDNKIQVGDLVKCSNKNTNAKCVIGIVEDLHPGYIGVGGDLYDKFSKITNPELIKLLEQEIK